MIKKLWAPAHSYCRKYREPLLYLIFGVATTAVNYLAYFLCTRGLALPMTAANAISWVCAVSFAYATNRRWVFRSKVAGFAGIAREAGAFAAARVFSGVLEILLMLLLVDVWGFDDLLMKLGVNVVVIVVNYVLSKLVVFRGRGGSAGEGGQTPVP